MKVNQFVSMRIQPLTSHQQAFTSLFVGESTHSAVRYELSLLISDAVFFHWQVTFTSSARLATAASHSSSCYFHFKGDDLKRDVCRHKRELAEANRFELIYVPFFFFSPPQRRGSWLSILMRFGGLKEAAGMQRSLRPKRSRAHKQCLLSPGSFSEVITKTRQGTV